MAECLALTDLGARINLMPLSVWNKLSLPNMSPMCMTLEHVDCLISRPVGVAEDVFVKVGTFHFPADFVVIDFDVDPRTLRYSANYNDMTANRIDVIDMACEEYSQEVLGFSDVIATLEDDPTSPKVDQSYVDTEGDILLLEAFLNDDPSLTPPNQGYYLPQVRKELKIHEAKTNKSSIDEPPEVVIKDLLLHLEYAFLEGDNKLLVIIAKYFSVEKFLPTKFSWRKTFPPAVQHQRRVNLKIHDVIKNEVLKLLDAGLIYPISNSPWVSLVHCVPKKGGFTVVENEENELISTRLVTGWRVCIEYQKLNEATRTFQRCMMAIFHDMIGKTMEVFMDDFSVFGNSFQTCLSHLERMLKRCEDTNLCLNWEKSHFMVKEGIVLSHKISKNRIEVDKAKIDVIAKFPHPITVNGIRSFLGHAGFYRSDFDIGAVLGKRQEKHFRPTHYASKTMTEAESNYTTTEKEMLAVVYAFEKLRKRIRLKRDKSEQKRTKPGKNGKRGEAGKSLKQLQLKEEEKPKKTKKEWPKTHT
nr:hypothetical protein [Tanacetum cinerariifolium]